MNWLQQLEPFNYEIIFRPGKENPADGLSRRPDYEDQPGRQEARQTLIPGFEKKFKDPSKRELKELGTHRHEPPGTQKLAVKKAEGAAERKLEGTQRNIKGAAEHELEGTQKTTQGTAEHELKSTRKVEAARVHVVSKTQIQERHK